MTIAGLDQAIVMCGRRGYLMMMMMTSTDRRMLQVSTTHRRITMNRMMMRSSISSIVRVVICHVVMILTVSCRIEETILSIPFMTFDFKVPLKRKNESNV